MTTQEKVNQALVILGRLYIGEEARERDYQICAGHVGPDTTPESLARAVWPFFPDAIGNAWRDKVALAAMQSILISHASYGVDPIKIPPTVRLVAKWSYEQADALIKFGAM